MFSNAKKSILGDTTWKCSRQHCILLHSYLKNTVKLHLTVFSEVTEYKTLNTGCMFHIFTAYALCNSNLFTVLCKIKKYTLLYNKHKLPLGGAVHNCKQYFSTYWNCEPYWNWTYNTHSTVIILAHPDIPLCLAT